MQKKILYLDMDGVLVDLMYEINMWFENHPHLIDKYKNHPDHIPGIYRFPPPIDGAIEAVKLLDKSGKYDMFIATTAAWGNPEGATDKRHWIEKYFGDLFHKKMFITHRKDLLRGDILIDDRLKNGAAEFQGEFIHFGWDYENELWNPFTTWDSVLKKPL
jgi:5'(3')-deoxyribonucleotidase